MVIQYFSLVLTGAYTLIRPHEEGLATIIILSNKENDRFIIFLASCVTFDCDFMSLLFEPKILQNRM